MDNYNEILKLITCRSFEEVMKITYHTKEHITACLLHFINNNIEEGDIDKVADITSYSYDMVRSVFKNRRTSTAIVEAAAKLIAKRIQSIEDLKKEFQPAV